MNYKEHIVRDPEILLGKPTIKGTRITVELIMRKLSSGYTISDLLKNYPHLKAEQIASVFRYTAELLANEELVEV